MTEPGTLPEGIDQLIWQISVSLADALFWPKNSNEEQRKLIEISLSAAYVQGAAQERARLIGALSEADAYFDRLRKLTTNREVWNLANEDATAETHISIKLALAIRTPPPPEASHD